MLISDIVKNIESGSTISCGETANINLSFKLTPDISQNPLDIVMVLDISNSMYPNFDSLQAASNSFINIIYNDTNGVDNNIAGGTRIGLVTFGTSAYQNSTLTTDITALKYEIDNITYSGNTNHRAAFRVADETFDYTIDKRKVLLFFTDGVWNEETDPIDLVRDLKSDPKNVEIYVIGYNGIDGIRESDLMAWATKPEYPYYNIFTDISLMKSIFDDISKKIEAPPLTGMYILEEVEPYFTIDNINTVSYGTISMINKQSFKWDIGTFSSNTVSEIHMNFTIKHNGLTSGKNLYVNKNIEYHDNDSNTIIFPDPLVNIICHGNPMTIYKRAMEYISISNYNIYQYFNGSLIYFEILVTNPSNTKIINVTVKDELYKGLTYSNDAKLLINELNSNSISVEKILATDTLGETLIFHISDLNPSDNGIISFSAMQSPYNGLPVNKVGVNLATLSYMFLGDTLSYTNQSNEVRFEYIKNPAKPTIYKYGPNNVLCNEIFSYIILIKNEGEDDIFGITLNDKLPTNFNLLSDLDNAIIIKNNNYILDKKYYNIAIDEFNKLTIEFLNTMNISPQDTISVEIKGYIKC